MEKLELNDQLMSVAKEPNSWICVLDKEGDIYYVFCSQLKRDVEIKA